MNFPIPNNRLIPRYLLAVLAVAAGWGARCLVTYWFGPGLGTYSTFYPAIMIVALFAGLGPGLAAIALTALVAAFWILPTNGPGILESPIHQASFVIFLCSGLMMNAIAQLYRRDRNKAIAYNRERALREGHTRLAAFGMATFEGIVETEAGRIVDCNKQFGLLLDQPVYTLKGMELSELVVPRDRERLLETFQLGDDSVFECTLIRKDGSHVTVEARGRSMPGGNARRLTAMRDITARKQAAQDLIASRAAALNLMEDAIAAREQAERSAAETRESEERFRSMFESHQSVKLVIDPENGEIVDANEAAALYYGFSRDELRARRIQDINLLPPDELGNGICEAAAGQRSCCMLPQQLAGGETRWVEVYPTPIEIRGRKLLFYIIHDVTERRTAEAALQESDHRMRLATEATGVGIWEWHVPTGRIKWDAQMFRLYGIEATDDGFVNYEDWTAAVFPEELARQEEILQDTYLRKGTGVREFRIRRRDNSEIRHIHAVDAVRTNADGKAEWVVGTNLDITERKATDEALRCSEQFALRQWAEVEATLEAIPANIAILDSTGVVVRVNSAWKAFASENDGKPSAVEVGVNYLAVCDSATGPEMWHSKYFATGIRNVISGKCERFSMEYPCHSPTEQRWFMGYVTASRGGGDACAVIAHVDISALKRTEGQIRQLNEALELRVTERTTDLRNAIKALESEMFTRQRLEREILEISEKEQSRLGQDLHDGLGQELAGIALIANVHAEKLRSASHPEAETAARISGYIRESIESARRLAKGLYPVELSRYGLQLALEDLASQTSRRFGIHCELRQDGDLLQVDDSAAIHIYRIVQESIGNAIKHGQAGHIIIHSLADADAITLTVTDDGVGFRKTEESSGMGLHLMDYRARIIGANVSIDRPSRGGCRVTCRIPQRKLTFAASEIQTSGSPAG